ncbi:hypothetical protein ACDW_11010 [Acidovorax sp. DW039]|uniref:hypothetical protein n=1 Tax=Acidovorax sp. DW039 TaxID=3095606 RepID=UPI00308485B0|nr:hypothetical protein ACDW_11010 [Acidovorax sp. DW039]
MTEEESNQFQIWLMDMDEAIERFQRLLPSELQGQLDYSPESLGVVESFGLAKYSTVGQALEQSEAAIVDGMARHVGEVFRRRLGGKWVIDYSDKNNVFYALPQLVGMAGQKTQCCPLTLVTASLDRRTGRFIRLVFDNYLRNAV